MSWLYPRLDPIAALNIYHRLEGLEIEAIQFSTAHDETTYNPVGGTPVTGDELTKLRQEIAGWLDTVDYPEPSNQEKRRRFDSEIGKILGAGMDITIGEASRNNVWSFIGCVLMPDYVAWRFPSREKSRFIGGVRNTFQRLWWRAKVLYDDTAEDPYHLLGLPEDALVQIMERSHMMADWRFSRIIALQMEKLVGNEEVGANLKETVWRDASKRIRQKTPLISPLALDDNGIESFVGNCFIESMEHCSR